MDLDDLKDKKFFEQDKHCGNPDCHKLLRQSEVLELAHILPQRKWIIQKYGKEIIHHELNMKLTHPGYCNSAVQMSPNKTELVNSHIKMIQEAIDNE